MLESEHNEIFWTRLPDRRQGDLAIKGNKSSLVLNSQGQQVTAQRPGRPINKHRPREAYRSVR
jgi:hypothetical protein